MKPQLILFLLLMVCQLAISQSKSNGWYKTADGKMYDILYTKSTSYESDPAGLKGIGYKTEYALFKDEKATEPFAMVKLEHIRGKSDVGNSYFILVSISSMSSRTGSGWGYYNHYYNDYSNLGIKNNVFDFIHDDDKDMKGVAKFSSDKKEYVELKYIKGDKAVKGAAWYFDEAYKGK